MVFPVALSGQKVTIVQDWCRGCDDGKYNIVKVVKGTGYKAKVYCEKCWEAYLPKLTAAERGEDLQLQQQDGTEAQNQRPVPAHECAQKLCRNDICANKGKHAKHRSGYCSFNCAEKHGWEDSANIFVPCKNMKCTKRWRKAKHYSGYCTYTCAIQSGWQANTQTDGMRPSPMYKNETGDTPSSWTWDEMQSATTTNEDHCNVQTNVPSILLNYMLIHEHNAMKQPKGRSSTNKQPIGYQEARIGWGKRKETPSQDETSTQKFVQEETLCAMQDESLQAKAKHTQEATLNHNNLHESIDMSSIIDEKLANKMQMLNSMD